MELRDRTNRWGALVLIAGLCLAAVALISHPGWTLDDTYITLRYARNLAEHGQLTWNVEEAAVEGYTGIFLPGALALAMAAGVPALAVGKGLGVVSFLASGPLLFGAARTLGVRGPLAGAAACLMLLAPFLHLHATGGLETTIFGAAVTLCLWLLARAVQPDRRWRDAPMCLALLFASLVRPEGVALAVATVVVLGWMRVRTSPRAGAEFLGQLVALLVLPGVAYMAWRLDTYGQLLPNSFHAKALDSWFDAGSAASLGAFGVRYAVAPLVAVVALVVIAGRQAAAGAVSRPEVLRGGVVAGIAALFVAALAFVYLGCHLAMNVGHRFFVPFYPVVLLVAALGWEAGWRAVAVSTRSWARRAAAATGVTLVFVQLAAFALEAREHRSFAADYAQLLTQVHLPAGERVAELIGPDQWLVVVADAGAIPYMADRPTVDLGMINDARLARGPRTSNEIVEYFFERDATCAVFTSTAWETLAPPDPRAAAIVADDRFSRYELVERYRTDAGRFRGYFEFVLVRGDPAP